ncbi:hypothetical protein [Actinomadura madurae]|uniref:hypothetical protein n=1 Tax=Actinomadura madurae TaxID=1993 RepID=UPI000D86E8AE|nr:hypothetical protein [Actinomadura madurae]SPT49946.1 Uncharacterised protein [Actinomadura madurae]
MTTLTAGRAARFAPAGTLMPLSGLALVLVAAALLTPASIPRRTCASCCSRRA